MHPLARHIGLGIVALVLVAGVVAAALWAHLHLKKDDSFAALLPAQAVLAYIEEPGKALTWDDLVRLAPALPAVPAGDLSAVDAAAAVRMEDGREGWIFGMQGPDGMWTTGGSNAELAALLDEPAAPLARDQSYRTLAWREEGDSWAYIAPATRTGNGSLDTILTSGMPLGVARVGETFSFRVPVNAPTFYPLPQRPAVLLESPLLRLSLPSWNALLAVSKVFSTQARTVLTSLSTALLENTAPGHSLRYDLAPLLDGPFLLQLGTSQSGTVFALEGHMRAGSEGEQLLRSLHRAFASAQGGAELKTITSDTFVLTTVTRDDTPDTTELQDGAWQVLRTDAGDETLLSAQNGLRFVLTTDPDAFAQTTQDAEVDRDGTAIGGTIRWTEQVAAALAPLWPALLPGADTLSLTVRTLPNVLEVHLSPVRAF